MLRICGRVLFVRRVVALGSVSHRGLGGIFRRDRCHEQRERRVVVRLVRVRLGLRGKIIRRTGWFGCRRCSHADGPGPKDSQSPDANSGPVFAGAVFAAFSAFSACLVSTKRRAGPAGAANSAARTAGRAHRKKRGKAWKNRPAKMARCLRMSVRNKSIRIFR